MSIASYGQLKSDDKTCLFPEEMDYFLRQDLRAKSLAKDSILLADKLELKSIDIATLKANEYDLKSAVKKQEAIAKNWQTEAANNLIKYNNSQVKVTRRGGIIIGSVSLNLLFIGAAVLILK